MHRFWVAKPPTAYGKDTQAETEQSPEDSPALSAAIREITDTLRAIIMRHNVANDVVSAGNPFQLFEMHPDVASLLGLREHCWVMLELSGQSPRVIFEDRDLATLKRRIVSDLEGSASALHYQLENPTAFKLLTRQ